MSNPTRFGDELDATLAQVKNKPRRRPSHIPIATTPEYIETLCGTRILRRWAVTGAAATEGREPCPACESLRELHRDMSAAMDPRTAALLAALDLLDGGEANP